MNENARTGIYLVTALVVGALAFATRPKPIADSSDGPTVFPPNTRLVKDLKPSQIKAIEIQRYDDKLAKKSTFKVAVKDNRWVIPSHGDYPADAQRQLENITKALISAELYETRSNDIEAHETYGVNDPSDLQEGEVKKGVGSLVSALDESGKPLIKVIVGPLDSGKTPDAEESKFGPPLGVKDGGRFLRKAGENAVMVGSIDLDVFSTDFSKWIEPDLLQFNALDVAAVDIRDYAILKVQDQRGNVRLRPEMRSENQLSLDPSGKWAPKAMNVFREGEAVPQTLADDEEINNEQLNQMKTALDDLKIVDVEKKPENVNETILNFEEDSGEQAKVDQAVVNELVQRGFYPSRNTGLLGANGEVRVSMKDGIDYILRFGELKGLSEGADRKANRYLLVTAQFDPDRIPKPDLVPIPDEPEGPADPSTEAKSEEDSAAGEKSADEKSEGEKTEGEKAEGEKGKTTEAEKALAAEREKRKKDNQRKQDEYRDKIKLGKAKVKELNDRFADWFYVISDDVYKKVHLDRRKIVKLNPNAKEKSYTVEAFREMETEGIETFAPPPPPRTRP